MDLHEGHPDGHMPMAGVLPNFPYPFDFGVLEEFATSERQGLPIPSARRRKGGGAGAGATSGSPLDYGVSSATMTAGRYTGGPMSSSSEAEVPRMGGRHRKLSESVHPGRMRRKLAQFEGAGDDLVGEPQRAQRGDSHFVSILDTKTPLLGGGGDKRAGAQRTAGMARPAATGPVRVRQRLAGRGRTASRSTRTRSRRRSTRGRLPRSRARASRSRSSSSGSARRPSSTRTSARRRSTSTRASPSSRLRGSRRSAAAVGRQAGRAQRRPSTGRRWRARRGRTAALEEGRCRRASRTRA